jgi:transposase
VKETSSDMSRSMEKILEVLFPKSDKITDRFHFMKEVLDDVQTVRKNLKIEFKKQDNEARLKEKEMKKL